MYIYLLCLLLPKLIIIFIMRLNIFTGMTARTIAGCAMIPITVLKTRFESGHFNYTKMSSALIDIYSHEGLRGLSCGLVPTLARDAPYSGIRKIDFTKYSGKKNNCIAISRNFQKKK